jgi:hypothetical protein
MRLHRFRETVLMAQMLATLPPLTRAPIQLYHQKTSCGPTFRAMTMR